MRYYLLSLIFHVFLMGGLWLASLDCEPIKKDETNWLEIEVFSAVTQSKTGQKAITIPPQIKTQSSKEAGKSFEPVSRPLTTLKTVNHSSSSEINEQPISDKTQSTGLTPESYVQELKQYLEHNKFYPRQALRLKQAGVVRIKMKIDARGVFKDIHLIEPSTFPILDRAALDLLRSLGKFKPLPEGIESNQSFTVPIAYVLRGT